MDRLLIGVGSGRCGTSSLARLLSSQPDTAVTHERYAHKPRAGGPRVLWPLRLVRDCLRDPQGRAGDVALQWTWHLHDLFGLAEQHDVEIRVVGLRRDRAETIASYERWVGEATNHWQYHDGTRWDYHPWDHAYPCYEDAESRREAIGMYWDHVYEHLASVSDKRLRVWDVDALNTEDGVRSMLQHAGVEDMNVTPGIQENAVAA